MTIVTVLGVWFLLSIPVSLFAGKFIAVGAGSDHQK